jgi:integrase
VRGLARTWVFRYRDADGKDHGLGLGSATKVTVEAARQETARLQQLRSQGVDPATEGDREEKAKRQRRSFEKCAIEFLDDKRGGWAPNNERLWRQSLRDYAYPVIGSTPIADISIKDIEAVLKPIWEDRHVVAKRIQERLRTILDWAAVKEYRSMDQRNPADWSMLKYLLNKPSKIHSTEHHPAMPYQEIPGFIQQLYDMNDVNADCLAWCILTVTRSWEAIGTEWTEFKPNKMWQVPANRVKQRVILKLTLSDAAMALVERRRRLATSDKFMFPGIKPDQPIYKGALLRLLYKIRPGDEHVHGFRATFKTWAEEETAHDNAVIELALGHTVGSKVEQAYMRGTYLRKRFGIANDWANYLLGKEVTQ